MADTVDTAEEKKGVEERRHLDAEALEYWNKTVVDSNNNPLFSGDIFSKDSPFEGKEYSYEDILSLGENLKQPHSEADAKKYKIYHDFLKSAQMVYQAIEGDDADPRYLKDLNDLTPEEKEELAEYAGDEARKMEDNTILLGWRAFKMRDYTPEQIAAIRYQQDIFKYKKWDTVGLTKSIFYNLTDFVSVAGLIATPFSFGAGAALSTSVKIGAQKALNKIASEGIKKVITSRMAKVATTSLTVGAVEGFAQSSIRQGNLSTQGFEINGKYHTRIQEIDWNESLTSAKWGAAMGLGFGLGLDKLARKFAGKTNAPESAEEVLKKDVYALADSLGLKPDDISKDKIDGTLSSGINIEDSIGLDDFLSNSGLYLKNGKTDFSGFIKRYNLDPKDNAEHADLIDGLEKLTQDNKIKGLLPGDSPKDSIIPPPKRTIWHRLATAASWPERFVGSERSDAGANLPWIIWMKEYLRPVIHSIDDTLANNNAVKPIFDAQRQLLKIKNATANGRLPHADALAQTNKILEDIASDANNQKHFKAVVKELDTLLKDVQSQRPAGTGRKGLTRPQIISMTEDIRHMKETFEALAKPDEMMKKTSAAQKLINEGGASNSDIANALYSSFTQTADMIAQSHMRRVNRHAHENWKRNLIPVYGRLFGNKREASVYANDELLDIKNGERLSKLEEDDYDFRHWRSNALEDIEILERKWVEGYTNNETRTAPITEEKHDASRPHNSENFQINIELIGRKIKDGANPEDFAEELAGLVRTMYGVGRDTEAFYAIRNLKWQMGSAGSEHTLPKSFYATLADTTKPMPNGGKHWAQFLENMRVAADQTSHSPYKFDQRYMEKLYTDWTFWLRQARKFPGGGEVSTPFREKFIITPKKKAFQKTWAYLTGRDITDNPKFIEAEEAGKKTGNIDPYIIDGNWLTFKPPGEEAGRWERFTTLYKRAPILAKLPLNLAMLPIYPGMRVSQIMFNNGGNYILPRALGFGLAGVVAEEGYEAYTGEDIKVDGAHLDLASRMGLGAAIVTMDIASAPIRWNMQLANYGAELALGEEFALISNGIDFIDPSNLHDINATWLGDRGNEEALTQKPKDDNNNNNNNNNNDNDNDKEDEGGNGDGDALVKDAAEDAKKIKDYDAALFDARQALNGLPEKPTQAQIDALQKQLDALKAHKEGSEIENIAILDQIQKGIDSAKKNVVAPRNETGAGTGTGTTTTTTTTTTTNNNKEDIDPAKVLSETFSDLAGDDKYGRVVKALGHGAADFGSSALDFSVAAGKYIQKSSPLTGQIIASVGMLWVTGKYLTDLLDKTVGKIPLIGGLLSGILGIAMMVVLPLLTGKATGQLLRGEGEINDLVQGSNDNTPKVIQGRLVEYVRAQKHDGQTPETKVLATNPEETELFNAIKAVKYDGESQWAVQLEGKNGETYAIKGLGNGSQGKNAHMPNELVEKLTNGDDALKFEAVTHDGEISAVILSTKSGENTFNIEITPETLNDLNTPAPEPSNNAVEHDAPISLYGE